jgi:7-carboxy-7-deazaguanine synthase
LGNRINGGAVLSVTLAAAVASPSLEAPVLDIFLSRQGEGVCVGDRHVFVRFGGCNLACDYCDTPESIPLKSGHPANEAGVLEKILELDGGTPDSVVSLTGGEPLLHIDFLEALIPALKKSGRRIYLETNGTLPRALARVVEGCDWIAMDLKPESAVGHDLWEAHRWFLEMSGNKAFVKLVLTDRTVEEEFQRAVDLIAEVRADIPLVLQPATPWGKAGSIPLQRLHAWWNQATRRLSDVRICPQIHRLWGIP